MVASKLVEVDVPLQLPIAAGKTQIIRAIREHATVIIIGETGSGKTTQVPQYLIQAGFTSLTSPIAAASHHTHKMIAVTQPRRVAAVTLARRVASEMHTRLGDDVGYAIRFEDVTSLRTRVKFMTDGLLLREMLVDPLLSHYAVVVLDEAHERTVRTDILFAMLKKLQRTGRSDLKLVVMSATLDPNKFSQYFDAPVLHVAGRPYPIRHYFAVKAATDYLDATLLTIFQIHLEEPRGDILVFLPGQEEIETVEKLVNFNIPLCSPSSSTLKLHVYPLFAALPSTQQLKAFEPSAEGIRKVILATNIAETSITISGIRYVIDGGFVKVKEFHPRIGTEMLTIQPISKTAARQRAGRAGREVGITMICILFISSQDMKWIFFFLGSRYLLSIIHRRNI
jgi:HrpA-like RNA helicase